MAKCAAFHVLGCIPGGPPLYAFAQRYITRSYFTPLTPQLLARYNRHVTHYRMLSRPGVALEFGAGGELLAPLLLAAAGARVYAYDVQRLATVERVNGILKQLGRPEIGSLDELEGIHYVAPARFEERTEPVDFLCSTSTFEHIPESQLPSVISACRRLLRAGGLASFLIDYRDHYDVPLGNFYRYSDRMWRLFNPALHHQNRLRHCDFARLFEAAGFAILHEERLVRGEPQEIGKLAERFRHYAHDDLLTKRGEFLLTVRAAT